jgi:hypothetical protein
MLIAKPEERRPLRNLRRRYTDNIKINPKGTEWEGGGWIHWAQDRDQWWAPVNTVLT